MATKKISELADAVLPLVGTETVEIVQAGVNVKAPASAFAGASAAAAPVQTEAADYIVDPADAGNYIRLTAAGTKTITVDPEATTALPANGEWHFRNVGAGDATLVAGSGVSISPPNGGTLVIPQDGTVTLKRAATDEFDLLGQTVAA